MAKPTMTTPLLALAGLLLVPSVGLAAGLGKLAVQSGLGQPLRAEIEIVNLQRGEAATLAARIASADAFREGFGYEWFIRRGAPPGTHEDDLFAPLR